MALIIRDAVEADLAGILTIHNDAVLNGTSIWSIVPSDIAGRRAMVADRRARGYPYLVADVDGDVAGYATFGDYRPFDGYARTVEHSVYVHPMFQRRGIASALLDCLVAEAQRLGKHVMVGGIAADNPASLALHARHGFVETGRLPEVGRKFGRYLDLVFMQRMLD